jgi:hypothetical protein
MDTLTVGTWVSVQEGCEITSDVGGSDAALLTVRGSGHPFEMDLQAEPLRQLIACGTRALAEMDALAVQEEASRSAREHADSSETAGVHP